MISIDWPHNNYHICPHYIPRITLGSPCDTFSDICMDTNWLIQNISLAKVCLIMIQRLKAFLRKCTVGPEDHRDAADWPDHLPSAFPEGDPWTKGAGGRYRTELTKGQNAAIATTWPLLPFACTSAKMKSNQRPFLSAESVRASGSVRLPTGQRDSLHSNYGSALFPRSTLEASVQSQTRTEQHEQERGHWQHRQAQHWCHWLLPHCYRI